MNPILARFAGEPAMVEPAAVDRFRTCLEAVVAHPHAEEMLSARAGDDDDFWGSEPGSWRAALRPYVVKDGILQIPVKGVLLHDFPYAYGSWATGYDYIWRAFQRGCGDFATGVIKGIALVEDSPGGMVSGCFDAVDKMYALKQETGVPVRAFAHESAYSAAYALFSLGDQGIVSRTGGVGSIGVVTMHLDLSKALDNAGYKITFIHAGKHKVDGNPYEPLPDDVKARIQARIDELYEVFVSTVARNRPALTEAAIRETEALTFTATQAVSNGLADSIGALDDTLAAYAADLSSSTGADEMSTTDTAAENQAAIEAARAEGLAAGRSEAAAEARKTERERVSAILGSDEAKGRESLANHIAMKTEMSVEDAKAMLAAAPVAAAASAEPGNPFAEAMENGNPDVGATDGGDTETAKDDGSDVIALARSAGLRGFQARKTR